MSRKEAARKRKKKKRAKIARSAQKNDHSPHDFPELPGLSHMAKPWQEFYRLVIEEVSNSPVRSEASRGAVGTEH